MRWAGAGVWERIFADLVADKKNQYVMIDSRSCERTSKRSTGRKNGSEKSGSGAFPRRSEQQHSPHGR